MQTSLSHVQLNVRPQSMSFYKDLMTFLGWRTLYDHPIALGMGGKDGASLWFECGETKEVGNDYDGPGTNHIAIGTESPADVDATVAYLRDHDVPTLFETPRHRPDFSGADRDYYQVMFESPDRILFEVVYTGP